MLLFGFFWCSDWCSCKCVQTLTIFYCSKPVKFGASVIEQSLTFFHANFRVSGSNHLAPPKVFFIHLDFLFSLFSCNMLRNWSKHYQNIAHKMLCIIAHNTSIYIEYDVWLNSDRLKEDDQIFMFISLEYHAWPATERN